MKVRNVNATSILEAIQLGCRTMQKVFDADDGYIPFFSSSLRPQASLSFSPVHSEAHVPGRHLNALLNAEQAAGVELDETSIERHRRALFFSYSGPAPLPLNRQEKGGPLVNFCPHNLREGFHGLYALAAHRDDEEARRIAGKSIEVIFDLWDPEKGWATDRLAGLGIEFQDARCFVQGEGRMIGPLVKYYRATGYGPALELALVLKEKAVGEFYLADGDYTQERFVTRHSHSITCVMSSLAQLADLLDDTSLLMRVKRFYDKGLWKLRDQIGWSPESVSQEGTDHGEANNTGDILETALILGRRGFPEGYHDAERILRCHLLPSQLRDVSFVEEPPNPEGVDGLREMADRHLGAFGFPAPYGHESTGKGRGNLSFNMDIVGGAVGSLCEAYREGVRSGPAGRWVNLLFDHRTEALQVESPYAHEALRIRILEPGPLFVRIPPWVDPGQVHVEGTRQRARWTNGYLFFAATSAGETIQIRFPLVQQEICLSPELHVHPIRVRLRGDSVVAMDSYGADLTFFDEYE